MAPGTGAFILGRGHISHYSGYILSSILFIYFILCAIVMLLSYFIVDFCLLYDGAVELQI